MLSWFWEYAFPEMQLYEVLSKINALYLILLIAQQVFLRKWDLFYVISGFCDKNLNYDIMLWNYDEDDNEKLKRETKYVHFIVEMSKRKTDKLRMDVLRFIWLPIWIITSFLNDLCRTKVFSQFFTCLTC